MEEENGGVAIADESGGGGGGGGRKEKSLDTKLRRGVAGRKDGRCTPVPPWKLEESGRPLESDKAVAGEPKRSSVSARKLGANLWEMQDLLGASAMVSPKGCRRRGGQAHGHGHEHSLCGGHEEGPCAGSLRRHIVTSLTNHQKFKDTNNVAVRVDSPASCSSSLEISAFKQAMTPSSCIDLKAKTVEYAYSLKTSTELLKVLNRIWSLEEQHASHLSLIKALNMELDRARILIKELMQEKHAYCRKMDDLLTKVAEDKLIRKNKDKQKIKAAVRAVSDELEDERVLRRHSESLHQKLEKELSEMKSAFMKSVEDLEKERKMNGLLEEFCDEFSKGVRGFEEEVRDLKRKPFQIPDHKVDRLILHLAEAWLHERVQMKIAEGRGDSVDKKMMADRLSSEIRYVLQAKKSGISRSVKIDDDFRCQTVESFQINNGQHQSLESVHLNGKANAPQDGEDNDSIARDFCCFELTMGSAGHTSNHRNVISRV